MDQFHPVGPRRQVVPCHGDGRGIAIEPEDSRGAGLQERAGMAAEPDGAIDEVAASLRLEVQQRFGGQHGDVGRQIPNSASAQSITPS
jgi:hypothetical protein